MEITKIKESLIKSGAQLQQKAELTPVARTAASFIGAFLLMNPFVSGEFSPFAVSLAAASGVVNSFCAGAGTIIGAFFFFGHGITPVCKKFMIVL